MKSKLSSEDKQTIKKLYQEGYSLYFLAKKYKIRYTAIKYWLIKLNVEIRKGNQNKIHTENEEYFSIIDSHEKAYWLGFIAADGSVSKKENQISIGLSKKDISHLELFKKCINATGKIFVYDSILKGKIYHCCKFSVYSKKMKTDLAKHNILPNKSKTLKLSKNISKEYINSYLLGLIDGDGCFSIDNQNQARLNFISSKYAIIEIQKILMANCDINKTKISKEKRSEGMYYLNYGGNTQMKSIVKYLYKNSKIYLKRKKIIIDYLL